MKNDIKTELENYEKYVEVVHSDFSHQDKKVSKCSSSKRLDR